jgi:hypothetical protein
MWSLNGLSFVPLRTGSPAPLSIHEHDAALMAAIKVCALVQTGSLYRSPRTRDGRVKYTF